eukprot:GCRY01002357.1.p1 GENE.GCRY01002357.1~~GCRY01002357.1.p1  ORF type:complete len:376 (+),score=69.82 GCRY01002357.1:114-1241(+)
MAEYNKHHTSKNPPSHEHRKLISHPSFTVLTPAINDKTDPFVVTLTGAAGQIGYSLIFAIARGELFPGRSVHLRLLDLPNKVDVLHAISMELHDCALSTLASCIGTDNPEEAFQDADIALLVGAFPRLKGMERRDLLEKNIEIFVTMGRAIEKCASIHCRVVVVGNPCNTNALVTMLSAPSLPKENFTALMRLDVNRMKYQISRKLDVNPGYIHNCVVWGNHSKNMFADISQSYVNAEKPGEAIYKVADCIDPGDSEFWEQFKQTVQLRGADIIEDRGASSAASTAQAIVDHVREWMTGTSDTITCMAIASKGWYGVPEDIFFSFPVKINELGDYKVVEGITLDESAQKQFDINIQELQEEKTMALEILKSKGLL